MLQNVKVKKDGKSLTITVPDTTKDCRVSDSGKSITVASTGGNIAIEGGLMLGVNLYKANPNREKDVAAAIARKAAAAAAAE